MKCDVFYILSFILLVLLPHAQADGIPYYAQLVLQGDYTKIPSYFKADTTGTIAVHYGRPATILNYDGSDSSQIVINYSVQIGINGETISDALNYIQTPVAHWLDPISDGGGFPVPWNNPTITYTVTSSENTGVGYTFSMPAATTGNGVQTTTSTTSSTTSTSSSTTSTTSFSSTYESKTTSTTSISNFAETTSAMDTDTSPDNSGIPTTTATPTPTSTDVVYVSTSATVSVNANYSQVNIADFRSAAQTNLVNWFSIIPYSNLSITDIRAGSIITDYIITYPEQYQAQVEALASRLASGTFAGYDVISADSTGTVRDQNSGSTTTNNSSGSSDVGGIVGGVVGGVVGAAILALIVTFIVLRKKRQNKKPDLESGRPAAIVPLPPASREMAVPMLKNIIVAEELGAGKFGKVYKGVWNHTTPVALKCNKVAEGKDEFYNEMDILLKLNHPNVVRAIGIFKNVNDTYLVMEYLSKGALSDFLRTPEILRRLSELDLLNMCAHVAAGLHYLEDRNIVHRDLAARNLLVTEVDGRYIIKIADFGLSREVHGVFKSAQAHIPVKWSPPEVIQSNQYSTKSDIWSFAVAVWEIFTYGEAPYTGLSNVDAVEAVMKRGIRLPRPENCPEELYNIMLMCWQPDPTLRPSFNYIWQQLTIMIDSRKRMDAPIASPSAPQVHAYADMPVTYVQTSSDVDTETDYARYVRTEDSAGTNHYIRTRSDGLPEQE